MQAKKTRRYENAAVSNENRNLEYKRGIVNTVYAFANTGISRKNTAQLRFLLETVENEYHSLFEWDEGEFVTVAKKG